MQSPTKSPILNVRDSASVLAFTGFSDRVASAFGVDEDNLLDILLECGYARIDRWVEIGWSRVRREYFVTFAN